jgi:hypothetical protein
MTAPPAPCPVGTRKEAPARIKHVIPMTTLGCSTKGTRLFTREALSLAAAVGWYRYSD